MKGLDRRAVFGGLAALAAAGAARGEGGVVVDAAGRPVRVPLQVERVFPAGPPAAVLLYALAPDLLLGWPRAIGREEREFLLPEVADRAEVGRLTGRGDTANLETVLALRPDLIVDLGSTRETYVTLADRVQGRTGVPYALLDGSFSGLPQAFRTLGDLVGRRARAEELAADAETTIRTARGRVAAVPIERRPRVYYARGPRGLETALGGSINVETIELLQARNVAGARGGGLATVSVEQVIAWSPDVIVTIDEQFAATVRSDSAWAPVPAVRDGRVHLSPKLPFGWIDFPPSVNRLVGLWWLGKALYPDLFPEDMRPVARGFYARYYHVTPSDAQIERVLAGQP